MICRRYSGASVRFPLSRTVALLKLLNRWIGRFFIRRGRMGSRLVPIQQGDRRWTRRRPFHPNLLLPPKLRS